MVIRTSRGTTHAVTYAGKPTRSADRLILEMKDGRKLSEIAADFEGLSHIENAETGVFLMEGKLFISAVQRFSDGTYRVTVDKNGGAE